MFIYSLPVSELKNASVKMCVLGATPFTDTWTKSSNGVELTSGLKHGLGLC